MKKIKTPGFGFRRLACLALTVALALSLTACGGTSSKGEPLRAPDKEALPTVSIETTYCTLAFPEDLFENLRHMEVTEGNIAMEVFYMVSEAGEKELYRLHFADAKIGTLMGYLTTDNGEVPVSLSQSEYEDTAFKDEEERKLYHDMMDAISIVMSSLRANPQFSETKAVAPVGEREVKLRHWKVTLPENVQYTESEEAGNYIVEFYGEHNGEIINLFMVALGDVEAETTLGQYTVGGVQKPVKVQTYSLDEYAAWSEEEQTVIYNMMDSINTVIQTIVADKNFAEFQPAA